MCKVNERHGMSSQEFLIIKYTAGNMNNSERCECDLRFLFDILITHSSVKTCLTETISRNS